MIIDDQNWKECDMCMTRKPADFAYIAQGATGRWCVVLSVCCDCVGKEEVTSVAEARAHCNALPNSRADF